MPVKNQLKDVLTSRLGEEITAYKFKKLTGLGQATSLSAMHNPDWYPDKKTAETICKTFNLQLADFLIYVESGE